MDFNGALNNDGYGLMNTWINCTNKLLEFLNDSNIVKDKTARALMETFKTNDIISDGKFS